MANWVKEALALVDGNYGHWCGVLGELKRLGETPERITTHLQNFTDILKPEHQQPSYFFKTYAQWGPEVRQRIEVDRQLDREQARRLCDAAHRPDNPKSFNEIVEGIL
jgi:hypothetical protein